MTTCHAATLEGPWVVEHRSGDQASGETSQDLTLSEAAACYQLSLATLRRLVAADELPAYKVRGPRGREWRVSPSALEQAGYAPRVVDLTDTERPPSEVRRLTEALIAERARARELDQRLGYALLTVGRLRGRLRQAGIDPDEVFGSDLKPGSDADEASS